MNRTCRFCLIFLFVVNCSLCLNAQPTPSLVPTTVMQKIYDEVKTPYKYGVVLPEPAEGTMVDSPTIFRNKGKWWMTYIVFDGKGDETLIAKSRDLLHWETLGRAMTFTDNTWD